ncbi:MAG: DUF4349 domain-containing protein [Armatimonadetes bacterium]|nr:DUF4349 domain-containing protein [Armatimonadota bacterium]
MSIRDDLKAFLDGELSPERAAEVQAAIDQDPALRDEVLFMKILSGEIQDASREPQASGADKAVDRVVRSRPTMWKWGAYAASGVAGLFLIGLVGSKLLPGVPFAGANDAAKAEFAAGAAKSAVETASPTAAPLPQADADRATDKERRTELTEGFADPQRPQAEKGADIAVGGGGGAPVPSESETSNGTQFGDGVVAGKMKTESPVELAKKRVARGRAAGSEQFRQSAGDKAPATSAQPVTPRQGLGGVETARKVVRNADMGVKVKDVRKSVAEVERQVNAMNGFVGDTRYDGRQDTSTATMQFEVPEKSFVAMLDTLRRLGTVDHENVTGQDVTASIADGKGRITALADEEQNLIKELERARQSDIRLEIRRRLSSVRQDISGLKAQTKALEGLADMSRVSLTLTQSGQLDESTPNDWFGQTTKGAGDLLGFFGRFIGVGVIYLVFMAPVWLPIAGIVWWARKRAGK